MILGQQNGKALASIQPLDESQLPEDDVTADVHRSNPNCKGALAIIGKGKIIRNFPMILGIDFTGTMRISEDPCFYAGRKVLLTGWGVDENHWGRLVERAHIKGNRLVALPEGLNGRKIIIIGTVGFTAILCIMALEDTGIHPQDGEIAVTGASEGVDSTVVTLLHKLDYQVAAVSGHESTHDCLKDLGANRILGCDEFAESRPLEKQLWADVVDTIGDRAPAKVLTQTNYDGCAAAYGLAGNFALLTTVIPFILRNVRLQGVDSAMTPPIHHAEAWARLVKDLPESFYAQAAMEITLADAPKSTNAIINNQMQGHALVKVK